MTVLTGFYPPRCSLSPFSCEIFATFLHSYSRYFENEILKQGFCQIIRRYFHDLSHEFSRTFTKFCHPDDFSLSGILIYRTKCTVGNDFYGIWEDEITQLKAAESCIQETPFLKLSYSSRTIAYWSIVLSEI